MKLFEVTFQDESECTGFNQITELVAAKNEEEAIDKAWQNYYDMCGHAIKPNKDRHYVDYIAELNEIDGYEIILRKLK